jgi:hypothetical protein
VFRKLIKNKRALAVLGAIAVLAVAGIAVAFWTASGSGSGTGSVASTNNGEITLHGVISDELSPGTKSSVTFTADNSSTSNLQVGTIASVVSIDKTHADAGCEASDFEISPTVENQTIAAGASGVSLETNGSITMVNSGADQDACKGAEVTLTLTS